MKQYIMLAALIFSALFQIINGLEFKDCGSKLGSFNQVTVSDCDTTKNECILKRNSTVSINIDFTLKEDVSSVKTVVHGKVLGVEMPFYLKNPDACVSSGLVCPLKKDDSYEYTATLPVLKSYPKVNVIVKWELQNDKGEDIICVEIPSKLQ